jgi:hypothetical protein
VGSQKEKEKQRQEERDYMNMLGGLSNFGECVEGFVRLIVVL